MKKSIALLTGFLLGTGLFASSTSAQVNPNPTIPVPFSGTLAQFCSFEELSPGNLTFQDSQNFVGTEGSVVVICNTPGSQIAITDVRYAAGPTTPTETEYIFNAEALVEVTDETATYNANTPGETALVGRNRSLVQVSMDGTSTAIMEPGAYTFEVVLQATPN